MLAEHARSAPPSPEVLPVFPLTGVLLLPGNYLPLNVFEPRYRRMVKGALAGDRQVGMVQPRTPAPDNQPPVREARDSVLPELYPVGCVGLIDECEPQDDGRYLIVLRGLRRFRSERELARRQGYRRVVASYDEFEDDAEAPAEELETRDVVTAVARFSAEHDLSFDLDLLAALPAAPLVNGLAAALPFLPAEKQALLEAATTRERRDLLLALMGMGVDLTSEAPRFGPPVVN